METVMITRQNRITARAHHTSGTEAFDHDADKRHSLCCTFLHRRRQTKSITTDAQKYLMVPSFLQLKPVKPMVVNL